jgi:O-acetyl-ADP-ribose deacetylase (regulator of RNase III)
MTDIHISICDLNPFFVTEAHLHLMDLPNVVEVALGSIVVQPASAAVSPANSFGFMDGGVDWAYLQYFGADLQTRVQMLIRLQEFQELLVGSAIVAPTYHDAIPFLIVAPTMRVPKAITDPADVMLATRAAVRIACNFRFDHIVMPGMGTGCGQMRPDVAARDEGRD